MPTGLAIGPLGKVLTKKINLLTKFANFCSCHWKLSLAGNKFYENYDGN